MAHVSALVSSTVGFGSEIFLNKYVTHGCDMYGHLFLKELDKCNCEELNCSGICINNMLKECTILDQGLPCFCHLARSPFPDNILVIEKLHF